MEPAFGVRVFEALDPTQGDPRHPRVSVAERRADPSAGGGHPGEEVRDVRRSERASFKDDFVAWIDRERGRDAGLFRGGAARTLAHDCAAVRSSRGGGLVGSFRLDEIVVALLLREPMNPGRGADGRLGAVLDSLFEAAPK
jgi:hypothetical protein